MDNFVVREIFAEMLANKEFTPDKNGGKVLEILGASFIAREDSIFGSVNHDYVDRELKWYLSESLNVYDIPGGTPEIWKQVASKATPSHGGGEINSNYGNLVFSKDNHTQYDNVLQTLQRDPNSRRATMIYTRPTMHTDFNREGMSDFVCTNAVTYAIRGNRLHATVQMRSNDAIFGYKNDYYWQLYVLKRLATDLNVGEGEIFWQSASLHVYERHFFLVHHYAETGEMTITKADFDALYPDFNV